MLPVINAIEAERMSINGRGHMRSIEVMSLTQCLGKGSVNTSTSVWTLS